MKEKYDNTYIRMYVWASREGLAGLDHPQLPISNIYIYFICNINLILYLILCLHTSSSPKL